MVHGVGLLKHWVRNLLGTLILQDLSWPDPRPTRTGTAQTPPSKIADSKLRILAMICLLCSEITATVVLWLVVLRQATISYRLKQPRYIFVIIVIKMLEHCGAVAGGVNSR